MFIKPVAIVCVFVLSEFESLAIVCVFVLSEFESLAVCLSPVSLSLLLCVCPQ